MDNIDRLKVLTGSEDESLLLELLSEAREAIMSRRFPYGDWPDDLEPQYLGLQVQIAEAIFDKIGGKYETSHTENGVSRTWGTGGIPQELILRVTPMARGVR